MSYLEIFVKLFIVVFYSIVLACVALLLRSGIGKRTPPVSDRDRRRLSRLFVVAVAAMLVCGVVTAVFGSDTLYFCSLIVPTLFIVFYSVIIFMDKKRRKVSFGIIVGVVVLGVGLLLVPMSISNKSDLDVSFTADKVSVNGNYGEDIAVADITSVTLVDALPRLGIRVNGYSFDGVRLGRFKTSDGVIVWLHSYSCKGPFIRITTRGGIDHYVNAKDPAQTGHVFSRIVEAVAR